MKQKISLFLALCLLLTVFPFSGILANAATGVDVQFRGFNGDLQGAFSYFKDDALTIDSTNFVEGTGAACGEVKADKQDLYLFLPASGGNLDITGATHLTFDIWVPADNYFDGGREFWSDIRGDAFANENRWGEYDNPPVQASASNPNGIRQALTGLKAGWNHIAIPLDYEVNCPDFKSLRIRLEGEDKVNVKTGDKVLFDDIRFVSEDVLKDVVPVRSEAKQVIAKLATGIAASDCNEALAAYEALSDEAKAYVPTDLLKKAQSMKTGVDVQFRGFNGGLQNAWSYFKDDSLRLEEINFLEGTGAALGEVKQEAQDLYLFLPAFGDPVDVSGATYITMDVYVTHDNCFNNVPADTWSDVRGDDSANAGRWGEYDHPAVNSAKENPNGIRAAMTNLKAGWNHVVIALDYQAECTDLTSMRMRISSNSMNRELKVGDQVIFDDIRFVSGDVLQNEWPLRNAAKAVTLQIRELKSLDAITLSDEEAVNDAKSAYDAVDDKYKDVVVDVAKLDAAVAKIAQLKEEAALDIENKTAAEAVDAKIVAIGDVTVDKESAIAEARAAYAALSEEAKKMVTKLSELETAEKTLAELKQAAANKAAAKAVEDAIAALPAVDALATSDEAALKAAREAFNQLTDAAKELVPNVETLVALETKMIELKASEVPSDGFVIDGILDEYYIKEDASGNLYFFNDQMVDTWVSDGGWDLYYGDVEHGFEIYTAYDDDYLYFYSRAFDTSLNKIENDPNRNDSIALYLDPDPTSWYNSANADNGAFFVHTDDSNQGDMKFRVHGADLSIDDMSPHPKVCLGNDTLSNWLNNENNFKAFYFDDDGDGNNDGYGFEVRIPRVEDNGTYAYNFACGSYKENYADQCTYSLGRSWWMDYNSMAVVEYADPNPFMNQGYVDPELAEAQAVDALIDAIPDEITQDNYDAFVVATEAARKAYEALSMSAKMKVQEKAALEAAERMIKNFEPDVPANYKRGDINMDDTVNAVDALLVLQAAVGKATLTDQQTDMADLNGDGNIDAVDALTILKIAVGKE